jgi:hypothetical protein
MSSVSKGHEVFVSEYVSDLVSIDVTSSGRPLVVALAKVLSKLF